MIDRIFLQIQNIWLKRQGNISISKPVTVEKVKRVLRGFYSLPDFQMRFCQNHFLLIDTQNFSKTNEPISFSFFVNILYTII